MKTYSVYLLFLIFLLGSCATKVEQKQKIRSVSIPYNETNLQNISFKGDITSSFDGTSFSAKVKAKMAWIDSLSMTVIGPFGMPLGNVFAKKDLFVFYNTMQNEVMSGNPEDMDLKSLINVSFKFEDLLHFLRNEAPEPPEKYEIDQSHSSEKEILYKNFNNEEYVEYILYSLESSTIRQYQRKLKDGGVLILNILFKDHAPDNLARKIVIDSPEYKTSLTLDVDEIMLNEIFTEPFSFPVPKNAKKLTIEGME